MTFSHVFSAWFIKNLLMNRGDQRVHHLLSKKFTKERVVASVSQGGQSGSYCISRGPTSSILAVATGLLFHTISQGAHLMERLKVEMEMWL